MKPLPTQPEILYHPPKSSSFGHTSTPRNPVRAWEKTLAFLNEFTNFQSRPKLELRIQYYEQWSDKSVIERCIEEATNLFGVAYKSESPLSQSWELPIEVLNTAVNFALDDIARPKQDIGPTRLHLSYDFSWKQHPDLPVGENLGQGSYLGVFHGGSRLFLQPTFRFPFDTPTSSFTRFVEHLQANLPFKLKEAYFKTMQPSPSGKSPRLRNLPVGWLAA